MSKSHQHHNVKAFWLSETNATREPFVQIGISLLQSEKLNTLPAGVRWVYLCMCEESKGKKDFQFPLAVAKRYGIKSTTLRSSVRQLRETGFIKYNSGQVTRTPNEYSFSKDWKKPP